MGLLARCTRKFSGGLSLLLVCIVTSGCSDPDPPVSTPSSEVDVSFRNIGADVAYVGDDACASCHEEAYDSYQNHGMAKAMERLSSETVRAMLPSPSIHHKSTNLWYRAFESGGRFFQQEFRLDESGDTTHTLVREMMWVVGSGTIARTYLTVENSYFTEMPLTWYTQRETWDFSPGFEVLNQRFNRSIPDRCVACHNAYPSTVEHVPGLFDQIEEGISCERCHGPGEMHVNARLENPEPLREIDDTIVNSRYLSLDKRMDVCQQCHVTGKISILREDRGPFDFVPTEDLVDHVALFQEVESETPSIAVTSHAKRLRRSACFVALENTGAAMDCVTCHDPHSSFRAAGPEYFNATCTGCHDVASLEGRVSPDVRTEHESQSDCVDCHMPKADLTGVPHSAFTDHWIRVVGRTDASPTSTDAAVGELEAYFDVDNSRSGKAAIYRGVAYIALGDQNGDPKATERGVEILQAALDDESGFGEAHYQLGFALFSLGRVDEALEPLETSVRLGPDIPERLNTLAQVYEYVGRAPRRVAGLYEEALRIQPRNALIRVNYGRFLETQSRFSEARRQYETALEDRPSLATARYNLGTLLIRDGEFESGEHQLRAAIESDPDYSRAYGNLGILLATQGRVEEARVAFETGVEVAPEDPVALNNLGSFYLNGGRDSDAVPLLERAVEVRPDYVDALTNLALGLLRIGEDTRASHFASRALKFEPTNPLAQQVLQAVN